MDDELKQLIADLWEAASAHCAIMMGEPITENGDELVTDPKERILTTTQYLRDSA